MILDKDYKNITCDYDKPQRADSCRMENGFENRCSAEIRMIAADDGWHSIVSVQQPANRTFSALNLRTLGGNT